MMDIRWDEEKNRKLRRERRISFERIAEIISEGRYLAILRHPVRGNQKVFVIEGDGETIFLKTAFPSRKLNRRYGERQRE